MARFHKFDLIYSIAQRLEGSYVGLSIQDICSEWEIEKRTAFRILDTIKRNFPDIESVTHEDGIKRWRIPIRQKGKSLSLSTEELAVLLSARKRLKKEGRIDDAGVLSRLEDKLRGQLPTGHITRLEPDLEALMEAEGLAARPGPRPRYSNVVLEKIRQAILGCNTLAVAYKKRGAIESKQYKIDPYGLVYGHRHYLIGINKLAPNEMRTFVLEFIEDVEILPDFFVRDASFSLKGFTKRSFGVWQENPHKVIWKFSEAAAETAQNFYFHPDQDIKKNKDGTVTISFAAGGLLEMAWHLLTWGHHVEVISPPELADMIKGLQKDWNALP